MGDVPWARAWKDPVSCGKGCTIVTLHLCPGLVVPDRRQGQEKVTLHSFSRTSPHPWDNTHPNPPTGSLHSPAPSQCMGREMGSPFGTVLVPRAVPGAELSLVQPTPNIAGVCASQRKDAGSTRGGRKVGLIPFREGRSGSRGGQVRMGRQAGDVEETDFGSLPRRFRGG